MAAFENKDISPNRWQHLEDRDPSKSMAPFKLSYDRSIQHTKISPNRWQHLKDRDPSKSMASSPHIRAIYPSSRRVHIKHLYVKTLQNIHITVFKRSGPTPSSLSHRRVLNQSFPRIPGYVPFLYVPE